MPRNAQGVYTLPPGNPVVAGTLIETTWANPTMSDIAAALTGSLPRDGSAPMVGPLILSRDAVLPLEATTLQQVNTALGASSNYMPAGAIQLFAMSAIPTGWLECNGAAVSRTTYANLFAVIGTTYGAGDGSITFNLPDMRGMFARGWDHGRGADPGRALGSTQTAANQSHTHGLTVTNPTHTHSIIDPTHSHGISDPGHVHSFSVGIVAGPNEGGTAETQVGTAQTASAVTGIGINAAGTGISMAATAQATSVVMASQGTEARPTNVAMVYCIRAYGALQTDGLGTMAFQNADAVNITGGVGVFSSLQCTKTPTLPDDVARLSDIGAQLQDIFSSSPEVLLVDKTNPQNPILRPQLNVPNGTVQLDALGYVPSSILNITDLTFLGTFSALPGTLPAGTFATGDYYQIDVAGTLTLNTSGGNVAVPCNVGDQIIYNAATPGWWYSPASVASSLPATAITFAPEGTIAATNVQAAIGELDSETQAALALKANTANVLPLTGGTLSGALTVQTVKISGSGSLGNIGTPTENALQIDSVAKTIKALSPYSIEVPATSPVSGQVIQEKFFTDAGGANATTTPFKLTADFTITPKSTNSTIFISMFFEGAMGLVAGANPIGTFTVRNVDSGAQVGTNRRLNASQSSGGISLIVPAAIAANEANTALAARRYALYSQSDNTNSAAAGRNVVCSIREVQN